MTPTNTELKELHVQEPYLEQIRDGRKTVEGRLNIGRYQAITAGDLLCFNDSVTVKVLRVTPYPTFREMLAAEGMQNAVPDAKTIDQAVAVYRGFYSEKDELEHGVLAICIARITLVHRDTPQWYAPNAPHDFPT